MRCPAVLSFEGNVAENFRKFKQNFEIYLKASGLTTKTNDQKVAILLNAIGEEGVEIYNTFKFETDTDKDNLEKVLSEFEKYTSPKKNVVYERYKFYMRSQQEGELFDHFLTDIKILSKSCEFMDQTDSMIRDRIVLGAADLSLQEQLLKKQDLDLNKAVDCCRAAELTKSQIKIVQERSSVSEMYSYKNQKSANKYSRDVKYEDKQGSKNQRKPDNNKFPCYRCRTEHGVRECPAFGQQCRKCGLMNHFAAACRNPRRPIAALGVDDKDEEEEEDIFVDLVQVLDIENNEGNEWYKSIVVEGEPISFKLDTGSEVNIITKQIFNKIASKSVNVHDSIKKTKIVLEAYGGFKVKPMGIVKLNCKVENLRAVQNFVIVDLKNVKPILGLKGCTSLNLIKKVNPLECKLDDKESFINNNKDIFDGMGKFIEKCSIKIKKNAQPIVQPPRRIPLAIKSIVKGKLDELEKRGIIAKVNEPTEWLSNLVIVEKPNKSIRLCLDPHELNKVVEREHFLIPTLEEISINLKDKKVFTVLDFKEGYYQVELTEESSKLCSFSTPWGSYRFKRLPFGVNLAPEYFQKINQQNFGDIEGVVVYFDDLLISGTTKEQHDIVLNQVINRAKQLNVKFNKNKIQYQTSEVKYLGHIFNEQGMKPDSEKIRAIVELKAPKSKVELQRILGLINYLRSFIPNLASVSSQIRQLLKKNVEFQWLPVHEEKFKEIKNLISNPPVLGSFDENKQITIQSDASKDGLGCCLMQNGRPVAYASRSLSDAEKEYAQIEKEFLAIVYATKKFHHYIYGREVKVITDHQPIVSIMKKQIAKINSARLQRLKLKLVKYRLNVEYQPGKELHIADLLSRNYIESDVIEEEESVREVVHFVAEHLRMSPQKKEEFRKQTWEDETLKKIIEFCRNGWPKEKKCLNDELKKYWNMRNEIQEVESLLFVEDKIIVPKPLRIAMLNLLHEGHFGITKTKARAKDIMFWPNINQDIENLILKCSICEMFKPSQCKEKLIPHEVPNSPFRKIGSDILSYAGNDYVVIVDYYSNWIEVSRLKNKTSSEIIGVFKKVFSTFGIPEIVVADNMPYSSRECREFASKWDFKFVTSSPHYPKSNGLSEKCVGIVKNMLKKTNDIQLALLEYRNSPLAGMGVTPAQLMFNRRLKTKLPIVERLLKPQLIDEHQIERQIQAKKEKYSEYYNRSVRDYKELNLGDNVVVRKDKWEPAKVVGRADTPRSYIIRDENNQLLRRNRVHLRPSLNKAVIKNYDEEMVEKVNEKINSETERAPKITEYNSNARDMVDAPKARRERCLPSKFKDYIMN